MTDPLSVPQRRETSHRKAKRRSIMNTLQSKGYGFDANQGDDLDEPPEFADSDSDPAWTPQKVLSFSNYFRKTTSERKRENRNYEFASDQFKSPSSPFLDELSSKLKLKFMSIELNFQLNLNSIRTQFNAEW